MTRRADTETVLESTFDRFVLHRDAVKSLPARKKPLLASTIEAGDDEHLPTHQFDPEAADVVRIAPLPRRRKPLAPNPKTITLLTDEAVCGDCGMVFRKARKNQRYCSARCRDVAKEKRRPKRTGRSSGLNRRKKRRQETLAECGPRCALCTRTKRSSRVRVFADEVVVCHTCSTRRKAKYILRRVEDIRLAEEIAKDPDAYGLSQS
jgi:hypothetical protein